MARLKLFVIYVWIELFVISSDWFVSAKPLPSSGSNKVRTNVEYNLQNMEDGSVLTTDVDLERNGENSNVINTEDSTEKLKLSLPTELEKQTNSDRHNTKHHTRPFRHGHRWKSKEGTIDKSSKLDINRASRDDDNNDSSDDKDYIQSKDEEDDDDDVQLIIIPRKPSKRLHAKVQDNEYDRESNEKDSDHSDNSRSLEDFEKSRNSDKSEKLRNSQDFENNQDDSKNLNKQPRDHKAPLDEDSVSLERVTADQDDNDKDDKHAGDYDLHVKVKDKSGTNVKLSGDLPGNIGNLVAEGEGGARVQVQNSKDEANLKWTHQDVNEGANDKDVSTDDIAQSLMKMKSGKLKHAPYPSTVLLKPSISESQGPAVVNNADDATIVNAGDSNANQEISVLKSRDQDKYSSEEVSRTVLKLPSQVPKEEGNNKKIDQQSSNNVFSPMEFDNGDDELVATSRLLDIAFKADDETSLKEVKDSSNTRPSSSSNGITGQQRSTTISKHAKLAPEDYKKQSDDIDKESDDNWYKMQLLEDRIVNEGNSAKPGKTMGSYNGQEVSVVSPSQLQLLQTEYPSYPAYLTALQRTKVKDNARRNLIN